jgi:hypothetical protein
MILAWGHTFKTIQTMKLFLKIKHWQLFLILSIPFILEEFTSFGSSYFKLAGIVIYFSWLYTIGIGSWAKLPQGHDIRSTYFKISILFILAMFTVNTFLFDRGFIINIYNFNEFGSSIWIALPVSAYLYWSVVSVTYFSAKMLLSAMEGHIVSFNKAMDYFFAFWFFPVGIWYIQPKAHRLLKLEG